MLSDVSASTRDQLSSNDTITVLACDGGGIRGAATAAFLEKLEDALNQSNNVEGKPLAHFFDLFIGTSTGGLISLALGMKNMSAKEVSAIYNEKNAKRIFDKNYVINPLPLNKSKYHGKSKQTILKEVFSEQSHLSEAVRHCAVTAYELRSRSSQVLSSFTSQSLGLEQALVDLKASTNTPDTHTNIEPEQILAWQAGDVTSAAPTYFPPAEAAGRVMIDGGVVANDPVMAGIALAKAKWGHDKKIRILSVGTGDSSERVEDPKEWLSEYTGIYWWFKDGDLIGITMDNSINQFNSKLLFGEDVLRINSRVETSYHDPEDGNKLKSVSASGDMDNIEADNLNQLRELGRAWWFNYRDKVASLLELSLP